MVLDEWAIQGRIRELGVGNSSRAFYPCAIWRKQNTYDTPPCREMNHDYDLFPEKWRLL